ncbi:transglutaminase-like domain-containing protein [Ottowia testudinis]|uniref:Transglutaminase domain-containing protein n=1 Tax=Ottowia testudinis TaxID=2816950 RepID=A0A975CDV9_9BURK|nr:transglutaminase domain-containing protein [Ottowia testudinis]
MAIVRWVRNNIQWIPTWGSVQGSELTLLNQRGNAIDIASLTIALLRASGIPARYMFGTVDADAALVQNWIGDAPSPQVALDLMQQGGIAARGVVSGGRITKIRMEHAWVQAYVNWAPGRGALQGGGSTEPATQYAGQLQHPNPNASLNAWIGIDTSYKQYIFSKPIDIAAAVSLDVNALKQAAASTVNTTEGFIAGLNEPAFQTELQRYAAQVNAYLDSRPNLTLGDLVKSREVVSDMKQLLAGTSPFPVLASQETSTLPASLRHSVTLKLFASALDRSQDSPAFTWGTSLPALGLKRLGVTHLPASAADQQALESAYTSGVTSLPTYLLSLKPTLQLDGVTAATAPAMGAGREQYWSITLTDPSGVNTRTSNSDNVVGDEIVFGVNGNGISPDAVMQRLVDGKPDTAAGNLEQGALHYWLEHDQFDQMIASRLGVLAQRMPSVAIVMAPLTVRYFFGVPRSASYKSRAIDAKQVMTAAAAQSLSQRRQFMLHAGVQGSTVEGSVLDQILNRPEETSVSTTQLLAISARQGLRIYSITQNNAASIVPRLGTSEAVKQDIQNATANGLIAYVPERDITHKGYTGTGYLLLNPDTGEGAYLIDGGRNGGSQPTCERGASKPPEAMISVSTILNWETAGPALVGLTVNGADTPEKKEALKALNNHRLKPVG